MNTTILTQGESAGLNPYGAFSAMGKVLMPPCFSGLAEVAQYHAAAHDTRHMLAVLCY